MVKHFGLMLALASATLAATSCSSTLGPLSTNSPQNEEPSDTLPATSAETLSQARQLAWEAAVLVQNPPHPEKTWQQARVRWRQAIRLLEAIPSHAPQAAVARQRLAVYRANYQAIDDRWTQEKAAQASYRASQILAWQAAVMVQNPPHSISLWQRAEQKWQAAIAKLATIPPRTSVSLPAQAKLDTYRRNQRAIQEQIALEQQALVALQQFAQTARYLESLPNDELAENPINESIGIAYDQYLGLLGGLKAELSQLAQTPKGTQHPIYQSLSEALDDYEFAVDVWQAYLAYKQENAKWLNGSAPFNQLVPLDRLDEATLRQKYQVKTYVEGTKVSLKFTVWAIWQRASQVVGSAEQKIQIAGQPQPNQLQSMAWGLK